MKSFAQKKPVLFGIVSAIAVFVLHVVINFTLISLFSSSVTTSQGYLIDGVLRIIFFVPAVFLLGYIIKYDGFKFAFSTKGFAIGMFAAIPIFLCMLPEFIGFFNIAQLDKELLSVFPARIFQQLTTGLFEEPLYRGLLITAILIKWGDKAKGRITAALISALVFGLVHFLNVFTGSGGSITHVLKCFTVGIMFAAVYIYSGNLLSAMIMHSFYNIVVAAMDLVIDKNEVFMLAYSIAYEAILLLVGPVIAIILIRKAKPFNNILGDGLTTNLESATDQQL